MKSILRKFFETIDIYGAYTYFTIEKNIKSKTITGGILSLLSFIFFILYAILNSDNLIHRLNPAVTKIELYDKKYINVDNLVQMIPIALTFRGISYDEIMNYFSIYAYYEEYDMKNDEYINSEMINFVKCSKEFFPNISENMYRSEITNNSICLDGTDLNKTRLFYSEGIHGILYIIISYCINFINPNCYPIEQIIDFIQLYNYEILVSLGLSGINPLDYENPIQHFIQTFTIFPSLHYIKGLNIYIQEETLETDDGLLVKNNKIAKAYNSYNTLSYFINDNNDITLSKIRIYPSNHAFQIKRIYIKVQDYLSQIGGIISLALNIFPHFIYLISIGRRDEKILNVLIEFRNDRIHASSIERIKSLKTINNLPFNNKLSIHESNIKKVTSKNNDNSNDQMTHNYSLKFKKNNYVEKINDNDYKNEINQFIENWKNRKNIKINFSYWELLKINICKCNFIIRIFKKNKSKKLKIYYKFKGLISKFLDIPFFITKFEEYDKLKFILFNEKQLSLYKFISNDFIYSDDFVMKKKLLTNKKLFYDDDKKIVSTLLKLIKENKTNNKSEIDQRLIEFFYDSFVY